LEKPKTVGAPNQILRYTGPELFKTHKTENVPENLLKSHPYPKTDVLVDVWWIVEDFSCVFPSIIYYILCL
jgi:hypothetical protein